MKAKISELMDGELGRDEASGLLAALQGEGEARDAWRTYHLISDALRETRALSAGFAQRVAARLAEEPTIVAPQRAGPRAAQPRWFALSAAASVAAAALLRKIYQATERLSYTGTFVYQQGGRSETSRITRAAASDIERLEVLDGVPREIVRTRDTVKCYLPDSQTVKISRRGDQRAFPAMLPERLTDLAQHYTITRGETMRIAGYDCETVVLAPKDELRYGYMLWADAGTGMLLKARAFDEKGETVEQFTFTQLAIGNVPRDKVRTRHAARSWRVEDAPVAPASLADSGWHVSAELPGFRKVIEVIRRFGETRPVAQVVYSDGLAAVSVFIEPLAGRAWPVRPGPSSLGAVNIYTREVASHAVTVLGEAPATSVQRIANTVEFKRSQ